MKIRLAFVATIVLFALITRRDGESPPKLKKLRGPSSAEVRGIVCKVKSFLPSTGQVIIDQVPSLGRAVATAN